MSEDSTKRLTNILAQAKVIDAAKAIAERAGADDLPRLVEFARSLCEAAGDVERERVLRAELHGYEENGVEIPNRRRVAGHASPFPVRAIGLLEPEEIFLANREKFTQVTLTIGQPVSELESALKQIQEGGVLALRVSASEVSGDAVATDTDAEAFVYILPREIEGVVDGARRLCLEALTRRLVEAIVPWPDETIRARTSSDARGNELGAHKPRA